MTFKVVPFFCVHTAVIPQIEEEITQIKSKHIGIGFLTYSHNQSKHNIEYGKDR